MNRKVIISVGILLLTSLTTLVFNKVSLVLSIILILFAVAKHGIMPIKKELLWFVLICGGGAAIEIILVNVGNAWTYANPQFFGIPLYMPIFWGLIGTTVITLYQGLNNQ